MLGPIMTQFPECVRIAACSPEVVIGNPELNARALIACVDNTDADILVFPELFISGYTAADMFLSAPFLDACGKWARYAVKETAAGRKLIFFGCPVRVGANVYDCAIAAQAGKILAVIPKLYPANHDEFSEGRWFTSGAACAETSVRIDGEEVPFTKTEFEILHLLLDEKGRVFSRQELIDRIWPKDVLVLARTVDVNITRLRKKIGKFSKCIVTRLGFGYYFDA